MKLRKTLLAAYIAAFPLMLAGQAQATGQLMGAPAMQSPQDNANLLAQLAAQRVKLGLDSRHNVVLANQHPGAQGTVVSRADHTFKGVRVFGSESVVVSGPHGKLVSESIADRRSGLSQADPGVTPAISARAAIDKVVHSVAPGGTHVAEPSAELIIYPVMKTVRVAGAVNKAESELNAVDLEEVVDRYALAYLVRTRINKGNAPLYFDTVVSASDGSVLSQWSMVQTDARSKMPAENTVGPGVAR
jgi:Zn-dependent metalloprotease